MEDALHRAQMSVQPLKTSDTLACPGDPAMPTDPEILKVCPPLPSCPPPPVLVRSRATVEACPTPSGKPRHARSPDRLPVNFSLKNSVGPFAPYLPLKALDRLRRD